MFRYFFTSFPSIKKTLTIKIKHTQGSGPPPKMHYLYNVWFIAGILSILGASLYLGVKSSKRDLNPEEFADYFFGKIPILSLPVFFNYYDKNMLILRRFQKGV